jgi:large subunit ribosomal protein L23
MGSYKDCDIIRRLIVSEKSLKSGFGGRVIVCEVLKSANKQCIKEAVENLLAVKVEKVRTLNMPAKKKFAKGRVGFKPGYKKAYITLQEGYSLPELSI